MKNIRKGLNLIFFVIVVAVFLISCVQTYQIEYYLNGGIVDEKLVEEYKKGDEIYLPIPQKEGYTFGGWFVNDDFSGNTIEVINNKTKGDLKLYAKWEEYVPKVYHINYNLNGGNFTNFPVTEISENDILTLDIPVHLGYRFGGWYTSFNFDEDTKVEKLYDVNQDIDIYAKWNKCYDINYNMDGGILPNNYVRDFTEDEEVELPQPTKYNHRFLGWYDNNGKIVEKINVGTNTNITLFAKWEQLFSINLVLSGGVLEGDTYISISSQEEYELPIPTKEKYHFVGWYIITNSGYQYITKIEQGLEEDIDVFAKWAEIFKITYEIDESLMPNDYIKEYVSGQPTELPIPTKEGYTFLGWSEKGYSAVFTSVPVSYEEDLQLIAKWSKNYYRVNYVLNDGNLYFNKDQLYVSFFSDFYDYIINYRKQENKLIKSGINNVDDFLKFCSNYTGGAAGMSEVGNLLSTLYLRQDTGGSVYNQTSDDGFIGYCLENNMYLELVDYLVEFFYWWRIEEGYTNSSSDPEGIGSDFLASPWASIVDTAKFFYYDKDTLPHYFTDDENIPYMYDRIPYVISVDSISLDYTYDFEKGLTLPINCDLSQYTFVGWYLNSDYTGEQITYIDKNIYHDITIYGKFIKNE